MSIEKRKFPRAELTCKISTVFGERLLVFNVHTENVGEGGIRTILEERLHINTPVEIELFLKDKDMPIRSKGEVAWASEISPEGVRPRLFDTGIKFSEISEHNKEAIGNVVRSLLAKEGK